MASSRIRVLLVDDDDSLRLTAEHLLSKTTDFEILTCATGEAAVERLRSGSIDVMVLDHKMPGMTGLNVLQWMHERKQMVPTLMLTGEGSEHIAVEALKMGAYDYIRKDHLELKRLPIIIRGLHERKLFRDERIRREQERLRNEERESIQRSIQEAIGFLSDRVRASYMETFRLVQEAELATQESARSGDALSREEAFLNLRTSLEHMLNEIRSLLDQTYLLRTDMTLRNIPRREEEGAGRQPVHKPAEGK